MRDRLRRRLERLEQLERQKEPRRKNLWDRLWPLIGSNNQQAVRQALESHPAWRQLAMTMDPADIASVIDVFATTDWPGKRTGRTALAQHVYRLLEHFDWNPGPLALPREVAQIYLDDPDALDVAECALCGFRVPTRTRSPGYGKAYFDVCPLCGGSIRGEFDYFPGW